MWLLYIRLAWIGKFSLWSRQRNVKDSGVRWNWNLPDRVRVENFVAVIAIGNDVHPEVVIKLAIGEHCREGVIKDDVVLRCNSTGRWIKDQVYSRGVMGTNAKIDTTTTAHGPFRNLFAVLKTRVKYKDRASKDMSAL